MDGSDRTGGILTLTWYTYYVPAFWARFREFGIAIVFFFFFFFFFFIRDEGAQMI